jgi:predicted RNA-binding Zn-ribbon protein involved in translation (DUF1610 family)
MNRMNDLISRQAALDAISCDITVTGRQNAELVAATIGAFADRIKALPPVQPIQPKNGTLIIPLNESDFKSVKRIMLDNKPWCKMFYEEGGEAHWIKKYTPDDGEVYECDNCGVTWQFNDGGPEENEAFYCPKCGFKMERGEA